jgi:hypothetical protein
MVASGFTGGFDSAGITGGIGDFAEEVFEVLRVRAEVTTELSHRLTPRFVFGTFDGFDREPGELVAFFLAIGHGVLFLRCCLVIPAVMSRRVLLLWHDLQRLCRLSSSQ